MVAISVHKDSTGTYIVYLNLMVSLRAVYI
jgi:hypothetical protein